MTASSARQAQWAKRLSRQRVLDAAQALLRADGVAGLSIRRLASSLGVSPMAIYRHVPSKDALMSELFNQFIRDAQVLPDQALAWDEWIRHVGLRMYLAQVENPAWTGLLGSLQVPSHGVEVMQACLDLLAAAGFSSEQALDGFFGMVHASMGAGMLQRGFASLDMNAVFADDAADIAALLQRLPDVRRLVEGRQVCRSLDLLVAGMGQQLPA